MDSYGAGRHGLPEKLPASPVPHPSPPQAKPQALTDDQWVDQINEAIIKAAGLDEDEDEGVLGGEADQT